MMTHFLHLTLPSGRYVHINLAQIVAVMDAPKGGPADFVILDETRSIIMTNERDGEPYQVQETPEEVLRMIRRASDLDMISGGGHR